MPLAGRRVQYGAKKIGKTVEVPNNNTARLMFYLNCICSVIEIDSNGDWKNLRDYKKWNDLDEGDVQKLLTICALLDPDELTGRCIFEVPDNSMDCSNDFYELSANQVDFVAVQNIVIGGQTRRVTEIMLYKRSWMQRNYHQPIRGLIEELREKRRQEYARRQEWQNQHTVSCTIL